MDGVEKATLKSTSRHVRSLRSLAVSLEDVPSRKGCGSLSIQSGGPFRRTFASVACPHTIYHPESIAISLDRSKRTFQDIRQEA